MSEVKRYDMRVSLGGVESYESPCGDYVDYEDYAALEAKYTEILCEIKHMQDQAIDDGCRIAELEEALRDKQALIPDVYDMAIKQFESLAKSE